jgi:hypothetical protein
VWHKSHNGNDLCLGYADVTLRRGEYRYAFKIDGQRWRVPEGITSLDDGFGGRSALVTGAQASSKTDVSATSSAQAGTNRHLSAEAQATVDANIRVARERKLPDEPIRQRVAEGQAKGASDAQIAAASGQTLLNLQHSGTRVRSSKPW